MLDPDFDIIAEAKPMLERLFKQQYGVPAVKKRLLNTLGGYVDLIEEFPGEIRDLILQIRRKDYALNLKVESLEEVKNSLLNVGQLLSMALILSSMLICSAVLVHSESGLEDKGAFTLLGSSIFGVSICFIAYLIVEYLRKK